MIDTIVLTLTPDTYLISEPDRFRPSAHWALPANHNKEARIHYSAITSKQNATKKELPTKINFCVYKSRVPNTKLGIN